MSTTLADIAKRANVSASTVSRVISNHPDISEDTRNNVLKIMEEMKYQPNIIARSLARNSSKTIGVVLASRTEGALYKTFKHPLSMDIIGGLSVTAYRRGYNLLISSLGNMEEDEKKIRELSVGGVTDGIVYYFSRVNDPVIENLKKYKTPFVVLGKPSSDSDGINWVDNDNFKCAYQITELLIKAGRKKIVFAGASPNFGISVDKVEGYKKALTDYGQPVNEEYIIAGKFITENGYNMMQKIIESGIEPDAIVAQDDMLAFGMMTKMQELGYKIPEDIAIASFDNVQTSEYFRPGLTTVDMNAFDLGVKACELLLSCIENKKAGYSNIIVPSKIIERESI